MKGWIRGNTMIGPVLDVKVCFYQGRYGVEIMIESLFRDRTVSWVRIVNGINGYVIETSEEIPVASVDNRCTGKPVAKAKPRPKLTFTLTLVSVPHRERPKSWSSIEGPVVPLERNLFGHPLAGLLWERQLEKVLTEHG